MGRSASKADGLREAPRAPGLGSPSEDADLGVTGDRGAVAHIDGPALAADGAGTPVREFGLGATVQADVAQADVARADVARADVARADAAQTASVQADMARAASAREMPHDPAQMTHAPRQPRLAGWAGADAAAAPPQAGFAEDEAGGLAEATGHLAALLAASTPAEAEREAPGDFFGPDDMLGIKSTLNAPARALAAGRTKGARAPMRAKVAGPAQLGGATSAKPPPPEAPHYTSHRERLREKFMRAGDGALHDYELLELVLFRAIPRQDVKPLAKRLLARFGDFNEAISAPPALLSEVPGVGTAVVRELKIVEAAAHRLAQTRVLRRDAIQSWDQLVSYVRQRLAHEATEQFRILFLDKKNFLIADEAHARGTVDHVPVYVREVVKRSLELGASAVVLVHNHPSGDPTPSRADVDMTRRILAACETVGVSVHDHVVVGRGDVASFHALGLLDP